MICVSSSDVCDWLINERLDHFRKCHNSSLQLLRQSGLIRSFLHYWIKCQIADTIPAPDSLDLESLKKNWLAVNGKKSHGLSDDVLGNKLLVPIRLEIWCRSVWESSLKAYFLQQKSSLDKVTFGLIRVKDKGLASEIYHQIVSNEINFTSAVLEYSCGDEVRSGGLLVDKQSTTLPTGLFELLRRQEIGVVSLPLRAGDEFWIVQLRQINEAVLDKPMERQLLLQRFDEWANGVVSKALDRL